MHVLEESAIGPAVRAPRAALATYVAGISVIAGGPSAPEHVVLPDGHSALVFRLPYASNGATRTFRGYAVGTRRAIMRKPLTDKSISVAVRFRPGGAAPFIGIPMREITDRILSIVELWGDDGARLDDSLAGVTDVEGCVAAIERVLLARMFRADNFETESVRAARFATQAMLDAAAVPRIRAVAEALGVSERKLRRLFEEAVGLSPKAFARTVRLQRLVRAARKAAVLNWAELAVTAGYYDQSHMITEFRRLTGMTPTAFFNGTTASATVAHDG